MKMWSFTYVTIDTRIQIRFQQLAYPNTRIRYSVENVYSADPLCTPLSLG